MIAALEAARLIGREPGGMTLAHDALVTQWGRLRAWVAEARADRVLVEEIERDAERWQADDSAPLWKRRRLEAAEDVLRRGAVPSSRTASTFVRAGRLAERRGRFLAGGSALGVAALAALGVALYVRDVGEKKAEADLARHQAEANLDIANERKRENEELVQKLRDAEDSNALRKVQDEARKTTPPAASTGAAMSIQMPAVKPVPFAPAPSRPLPVASPAPPKASAQPGGGFF